MTRKIMSLWLGPSPFPAKYREYGRKWEILNPGWTYHCYSWNDLPTKLYNLEVIRDIQRRSSSGLSVEMPTALADVISYQLLLDTQGQSIYVNADIDPIRPLNDVIPYKQPWASYEEKDYDLVVNAAMGSPKSNDDFWYEVVHSLHDNYFELNPDPHKPGVEMVFSSGPQYLTRKVRECGEALNMKILPYYTFNPVLWKDVPLGGSTDDVLHRFDIPEGCIGVHQWGHKESGRSNVVD